MDSETLTEILSGRHLNLEERAERGVWPHASLQYDDVLSHLTKVITERQWFPRSLPTTERPPWVADFVIIERRKADEFLVHFQSAGPSAQTVAEQGIHRFSRPEEAAAFYLKWALNLPGDLDGWTVVA
jgi:hypothetical protein